MIKTSRILSLILTLIIASASWTGANAQFVETKGTGAHVGSIYYYIDQIANTAVVTNKTMSNVGSNSGSNTYSGAIVIPETFNLEDETYTVIGIQDFAFYGSTELISVDIPKTVTTIGTQVFDECSKLQEIAINPQNQHFYADGGVLYNKQQSDLIFCAKIKTGKFTVPSGVKKIHEFAFNGCTGITEVVLPNGVKEIGEFAFMGCTAMKSVNIPTGLTTLGNNAFRGASSLTSSINIPASLSSIGNNAFRDCSKISNVTIPEGITSIGDYAFRGCTSITSIELPSSLNSLGTFSFANSGLKSISIPNGITEIPANAFSGCKLTSITLPESLHTISAQAFYNNGTTIQEVRIPESVTSIANYAFNGTTVQNFYINNIPSKIAISDSNPFKADGVTIHVFTKMKSIFENATNWSKYKGHFVEDIDITHVESITLDNEKMTVLTTKTGKLTATINPADARVKDVVFTSNNPDVILISNSATGDFVAGANEGNAVITCTAMDGSGVFATCSLTVKKSFTPATSVTISSTQLSMEVGGTKTLTAQVNSGATFTGIIWISDDEDVATVDKGKVTAINPGEATITAISEDGAARATCTVTVNYDNLTLADGAPYEIDAVLPVKELQYVRNFKNTNWQPLYVPFRMSYEDWSDQFEVARLLNMHTRDTNDDGVADEWAMEFVRVKEGTLLENHPYIIRAKEKGVKTITLNNTTIYPAEYNSIECASTEYSYEFKGTYTEFDPKSEEGIYVMGGGSFGKPTSTTKVNPNRFYLKITAKDGQTITMTEAKIIIVDEFGFEETTAINSVESDQNNVTAVYNVNGIKQTSTKQGLNIIKMADGTTKKIFVK